MQLAVLALVALYVGGAMAASCDNLPPMACTREYAPVCATFIRTFPTACVLESQKCEMAKQGFEFVSANDLGDCCTNRAMTMELSYQCGTDGNVYDNPSEMHLASCESRDYIKAQDAANCPDFPDDWLTNAHVSK